MSEPGDRRPYRHRTPGRGWMRFAPLADKRGNEQPMRWLRRMVASSYAQIEGRVGARILGEGRVFREPLGCGMYGCVFELSDGRVLKVTSDASEGPMTLFIKRLQDEGARTKIGPVIAVTARIDDVFVFPDKALAHGKTTAVYGIVRERTGPCCEDLPDDLAFPEGLTDGVNVYTDGWDAYCEAEVEGSRLLGTAIARAGLSALTRAGIEAKRLSALLELTWEAGLPLMDVHCNNLARRIISGRQMKVGQILVFDFGGSEDCRLPSVRGARRRPMVVQDKSLLESLRKEIPPL